MSRMPAPVPASSPAATPANLPGVPEVRAVLRAVDVLRAFSASKAEWSLAELTQATGLNKATVRRLLHTLEISGLVERGGAGQSYALTLDLAELAARVHRGRDLVTMARPFLSQLAEMCGGIAFLWVPDKESGICLDRVVAASSVITAFITPGDRSPLNCGAAPRVTLAYLDAERRAAVLAHPQPKRTAHSITDPVELERRAALIRERGYEHVADDFIAGLTAVGVPVFDPAGAFVGALSITNLNGQFRLNADGTPEWLAPLQAAARRLGTRQA